MRPTCAPTAARWPSDITSHAKPYLRAVEVFPSELRDDGAFEDHEHPVGKAKQLIEVLADEQHCRSALAVLNKLTAHHCRRRHVEAARRLRSDDHAGLDRKSTRLNSSHQIISYAVFCLKKKT